MTSRRKQSRRASITARLGFGSTMPDYNGKLKRNVISDKPTLSDSLALDISARLLRTSSQLALMKHINIEEDDCLGLGYPSDDDDHALHFFHVIAKTSSVSFAAHIMVSHDGIFRVMDRSTSKVTHTLSLADINVLRYLGSTALTAETSSPEESYFTLSIQFYDDFDISLDFESSQARNDFCGSVRTLRSAGTKKTKRSSLVVEGAPPDLLLTPPSLNTKNAANHSVKREAPFSDATTADADASGAGVDDAPPAAPPPPPAAPLPLSRAQPPRCMPPACLPRQAVLTILIRVP